MSQHRSQWFAPKVTGSHAPVGIVNCPRGGTITVETNSSVAPGKIAVWLWAKDGSLICCYYCDSLQGELVEWES